MLTTIPTVNTAEIVQAAVTTNWESAWLMVMPIKAQIRTKT
jgi:hypothetical protein